MNDFTPAQSTGPVDKQINNLGACIQDDHLQFMVSACSDTSEDGEDKLKEEVVCPMVQPVAINQGNVSLHKLNLLHQKDGYNIIFWVALTKRKWIFWDTVFQTCTLV